MQGSDGAHLHFIPVKRYNT